MTTAQARYTKLESVRTGALLRARQAASFTIPAIMPPDGHDDSSALPQPYQSLGARGVNNLAAKMHLALFPPSTSFFRMVIPDAVIREMDAEGSDVDRADVEEALRRYEKAALQGFETSNLRSVLHTAFKHLPVTGNGTLYAPKSGANRFYPLDRYVAQRDETGRLLELVIKEPVAPAALTPEVYALLKDSSGSEDKNDQKDVDLYTHVRLEDGKHRWYQEIEGKRIPGTDGEAPEADSPWIVLRWTAVANEDYGRGMVEEYLGDLVSLDGLNKAILEGAAAAAKVLIMVKPNSSTKKKDLESENGSVIAGDPEDVGMLQAEKFADFRVAKEMIDELTLRLSHAFLLQSGTVRDAERVTAVEIRAMAQELEDVLGGVYTVQSRELQLPMVRRLLAQALSEKRIPPLPDGTAEPSIVTGFEALGRGHELNRFRAFMEDAIAIYGDRAAEYFDVEVGLKKLATQHNVDVDDAILSNEDVAQKQDQANAQALAQQAAGPVAGQLASAAVQGG